MCEASAYLSKDGEEQLLMESVDIIEPQGENTFRIVGIFGDQKIIHARIKLMNLVDHRIIFEEQVVIIYGLAKSQKSQSFRATARNISSQALGIIKISPDGRNDIVTVWTFCGIIILDTKLVAPLEDY